MKESGGEIRVTAAFSFVWFLRIIFGGHPLFYSHPTCLFLSLLLLLLFFLETPIHPQHFAFDNLTS